MIDQHKSTTASAQRVGARSGSGGRVGGVNNIEQSSQGQLSQEDVIMMNGSMDNGSGV